MIRFIKKVTKMGTRRYVEITQDYYDVVKVGDKVVVEVKTK